MEIVDIKCARIEQALREYSNSGTVNDDFVNGMLDVVDIRNCRRKLKFNDDQIIDTFIHEVAALNKSAIQTEMINSYGKLLYTLQTTQEYFRIESVLIHYRKWINPLRALYFELNSTMTNYTDSAYERDLIKKVKSLEFNSRARAAIIEDIVKLTKFLDDYTGYFDEEMLPIQLVHAQKKIHEMQLYYNIFEEIQVWEPPK